MDLMLVDPQAKASNAIAFQLYIPTYEAAMHVTDKGQGQSLAWLPFKPFSVLISLLLLPHQQFS
jgi:hypothetical protein